MKLIIAIVQDEDASRLISQLMNDGFGVTKLATTGGFLRAGNTTLLVGVDDDRFQAAMDVIEKVCSSWNVLMPCVFENQEPNVIPSMLISVP